MNTYAASVGLLWATAFRAVGIPQGRLAGCRNMPATPAGSLRQINQLGSGRPPADRCPAHQRMGV